MHDTSDMQAQCELATSFLKTMANPNRLAILCALHQKECNVSDLVTLIGMPQAALSNQLAILREAGFVDCYAQHRERIYFLKDQRVVEMIKLLHGFFCADKFIHPPTDE